VIDTAQPVAPATDPAAAGARRRLRRASAIGGLLATPVFYWMVNAGRLNPFRTERFGNFYDIQAHSLLDFRWDVPAKEVAFEGFLIHGKTYLYFGPVPALLRMPVLALTDSLDGRLTQVSMLAAFVVALVFLTRLSWRIRGLVRGDAPVTRLELCAVGGYVFLIATGSVLLFLASRAFVYHETELWGAALALAAYDAILGFLAEPSRKWILLAGLWSSAAFLTRATVGAGPVIALGILLAVIVLRRLSARLGAPARLLAVPDDAVTDRMIGWLLAAVAIPIVLYAYVNYSRFGTLFSLPNDKQIYTQFNPARQRALADNGGTLFGLKFMPTQLLQFLRPDALRFDSLFPWIAFPGPATVLGGVTFDTRDWASSITASMPALTVLGLGGLVVVVRRAGAAAVRIPLAGAVAGGLLTLTIAFVANRYMSDMLPAIVLTSLVGLHALLGLVARAPRATWTRVLGVGIVVLAVASLWINFALTISYQRALFPKDLSERAGFIGFQQDIDDLVPGGPRGAVRAGGPDLPTKGSVGEMFVVGNCGGLYWSDSREWFAVERGNGAGHYRLRVRFPDATSGQEPLLGIGDGAKQNVLRVRYRPDHTARFVLESPVAPAPLESTPQHIEPGRADALDVIIDNRTGTVSVALDGHLVLNAITFLVPGNQATLGSTTNPDDPARFTGTIRELPVRTPLCNRVRDRYGVGSSS
jgi:hypothetical protein